MNIVDTINNVLDSKLVSWFKNQGNKQTNRSFPWKWVVGLLIGFVAVVSMALITFKSYQNGKKLAKLKHEKDLAEKKRDALELKQDIEEKVEKIEEYSERILDLQNRVDTIDSELEETERTRTEQELKINAIENWKEMDEFIDRINSIYNPVPPESRPN